MKLSKTLAGIVLATSLLIAPSVSAFAVTPTPTPSPIATAEPISKKVGKKERKAILEARKSAGEMKKKEERAAKAASNKEAIAA